MPESLSHQQQVKSQVDRLLHGHDQLAAGGVEERRSRHAQIQLTAMAAEQLAGVRDQLEQLSNAVGGLVKLQTTDNAAVINAFESLSNRLDRLELAAANKPKPAEPKPADA